MDPPPRRVTASLPLLKSFTRGRQTSCLLCVATTITLSHAPNSRRMLNEEIDSLQRDLTLMKSRQGTPCAHTVKEVLLRPTRVVANITMTLTLAVNHESEVTTWGSSIKDLERQQDRLAKVSFFPSPHFLTTYWRTLLPPCLGGHDFISSRRCSPYKTGRGPWNSRMATQQEGPSAHHR